MGLGGYLTWTAAFHEIHSITGKKILPVEMHGQHAKLISSPIFYNNPSIVNVIEESHEGDYIIIPLNRKETNYCKIDTPKFAKHRYDKHIICQILEFYGIQKSIKDLQCRIYLTEEEKKEVNSLIKDQIGDRKFIAIEPHSNNEYTCNREYPFEKWQKIVDELCNYTTVVQVGQSKNILKNVIDITSKTTFRTCAGIIESSQLFLSTEGGLTHASQAMKTKSIVLITGYQHPDMVAYPSNFNFWIHENHGPCGNKIRCQDCWNAVNNHDEKEIVDCAKKFLL